MKRKAKVDYFWKIRVKLIVFQQIVQTFLKWKKLPIMHQISMKNDWPKNCDRGKGQNNE